MRKNTAKEIKTWFFENLNRFEMEKGEDWINFRLSANKVQIERVPNSENIAINAHHVMIRGNKLSFWNLSDTGGGIITIKLSNNELEFLRLKII
jgi:hypothetical protein